MGQHLRGKLGPAGRLALVRLITEGGLSERATDTRARLHPRVVLPEPLLPTNRRSGSWAPTVGDR
jgi:hypothetical protein